MSPLEASNVRAANDDPLRLVRALGLDRGAKRQPGGVLIACPAHDDRVPSCSVRLGPDGTIAVKCHACGFTADALGLIAKVEGLDLRRDFAAVLERGAELACVDLVQHHAPAPRPREAQEAPLADDRFSQIATALLVAGRLDGRNAVLDIEHYLEARGLLERARRDGWAGLPPADAQPRWLADACDAAEERAAIQEADGLTPEMSFTDDDARRCGLFGRDGFTHAEARILIPWRDPSGRVVNLQRRRLDSGAPRYVAARGRGFAWPYGVELLEQAPADMPIAFVEGAADVLALRALLAARNEPAIVVGLPGLAGWRGSWSALARGRVAAVAVDADDAGDGRVAQLAHELVAGGARRVERWRPLAKDWSLLAGGAPQ